MKLIKNAGVDVERQFVSLVLSKLSTAFCLTTVPEKSGVMPSAAVR